MKSTVFSILKGHSCCYVIGMVFLLFSIFCSKTLADQDYFDLKIAPHLYGYECDLYTENAAQLCVLSNNTIIASNNGTAPMVARIKYGVEYSLTLNSTVPLYDYYPSGACIELVNAPLNCGNTVFPSGEWTRGNLAVFEFTDDPIVDPEWFPFYWRFKVVTNIGNLHFENLCNDTLLADNNSRVLARFEPMSFTGLVQWEIYGDNLGCRITNCGNNAAFIYSGTKSGTITVRAYDANHQCYAERYLDLDDGKGNCTKCNKDNLSGSGSADIGSIDVRINLGTCTDGRSAGFLTINSSTPNNELFYPTAIKYHWKRDDVRCIYDGDCIRQIVTHQGVVEISSINWGYDYAIRFYHFGPGVIPYDGSYYIDNAQPYSEWIVENTSGDSAPFGLRVTQHTGSVVNQYEYGALDSCIWLMRDNASYKSVCYETNVVEGCRYEHYAIYNDGNPTTYIDKKYSLDGKLLSHVNGTSNALITIYSYYDNGLLKQIEQGDGNWEIYAYDASNRLAVKYSPFANETPNTNSISCRKIVYDYNEVPNSGGSSGVKPGSPRKIVEFIKGVTNSVTLNAYTIGKDITLRTGTNDSWGALASLTNINCYYTSGINYGKLWTSEHPDGTMEVYEYFYAPNQSATNITYSGQPDASKTSIVAGTKSTTITDENGRLLLQKTEDIKTGIVISSEEYSNFDDFDRAQLITYHDGSTTTRTYNSCCGTTEERSREGIVTVSGYDSLGRLAWKASGGITNVYNYNEGGYLVSTVRKGGGMETTVSTSTYDDAGRITSSANALNETTTYSETAVPVVKTTVYPDQSRRDEYYDRSGSLIKVTGNATHGVRYNKGVDNGGYFEDVIKLNADGSDTSETNRTYFDSFGRQYKTVYAGGATSYQYYNEKGQLSKVVDPDGVTTIYEYNGLGEFQLTAMIYGSWQGGGADRDSDRITESITYYTNDVSNTHGEVRVTQTYIYPVDERGAKVLFSTVETSVDGKRIWQAMWTGTSWLTNYSFTTNVVAEAKRYVTNSAPDGSFTESYYLQGRLQTVTRKDAGGNQLAKTSYEYDEHGRVKSVTDARNNTNSYSLDALDRVYAVTTLGSNSQSITYSFDNMGRITNTTLPDNTKVTNVYYANGDLLSTSGSRQYPVEYEYDYAGRMNKMKTWQQYRSSGQADTDWNYDARGFLSTKNYAGPTGTLHYTNTPAGRLYSRTWARDITTTYRTNLYGEITNTSYSDTTPWVNFYYNRLGQKTNIVDAAGSHFFSYNLVGQLLSQTNASGPLAGISVKSVLDSLSRSTNLVVKSQSSTLKSIAYGYDPASRLQTVSEGSNTLTYYYLANSSLIDRFTISTNGQTAMTASNYYDNVNRLLRTESWAGTNLVARSAFGYNLANQRMAMTNADNTYWLYDYDFLGQVQSAKKYWPDGTLVAGQQYEYTYDDVGNRKTAVAGGEASGANKRTQNYTPNLLNQITDRTVPGYMEVQGSAYSNATVTVNLQPVYRYGDYFRKEYAFNNSTGAVWLSLTNSAVFSPGGTNLDIVSTTIGSAFIPKTPEQLLYDADGNLTNDGQFNFRWDAENRLVGFISRSDTPTNSWVAGAMVYDWMGRRTSKVVSNWTGSAWVVSEERYVYDNWNLIAILDGNQNLLYSFTWGLDASRTMQRAGGVGGLISMTVHTGPNAGTYFYAYGGNYNVVALVNAANGAIAAQYEYEPFGKLIRTTGPMAKSNPFLFSTKFYDWETGLYYYGYRYYDPATGRWLSRDPVGERGGRNLYGFLANNSLRFIDPYGLDGMASDAYEYWIDVSADGMLDGGLLGYLKAGGGGMMCAFIDFWGTREVENNATKMGTAMGNGEHCKSALYGAAIVLQVATSVIPGEGKAVGVAEQQVMKKVEQEGASLAEKASVALAEKIASKTSGQVLKEQGRDSLGRFVKKGVGEVNPGILAEKEVWEAIEKQPGWTVIKQKVRFKNAAGQIREYDGVARSPSGEYIGLEIKGTAEARYNPKQRSFDQAVNASKGASAESANNFGVSGISRAEKIVLGDDVGKVLGVNK